MATRKKEIERTGKGEAFGLLLLAVGLLYLLSLVSYHPEDVSLIQFPPNQPPDNFIGPAGAWISFLTLILFGVVGYLVPLAVLAQSLLMLFKKTGRVWPKALWMLALLLSLVCIVELQYDLWGGLVARLDVGNPGGILGRVLAQGFLIRVLGEVGVGVLASAVLLIALVFLLEIQPASFVRRLWLGWDWCVAHAAGLVGQWRERRLETRAAREQEKERPVRVKAPPKPKTRKEARPAAELPLEEEPPPRRVRPPRKKKPAPPPPPAPAPASGDEPCPYQLPPLDLLDELPSSRERVGKEDTRRGGRILVETLAEFGIEVEVTNIETGPVVTRYELLPPPGVRVEKISGLSKNIALAMKAETVRIQAPIPGKGVVGIEVPNAKANLVYLRELIESEAWQAKDYALPLALGKDVGGREIISDLADMPHLLIAGATGSGKTVCMNSILAGLLLSRTPEELRLILIDPKIVEFNGYNHLPHLVVPVITDPKKVGLGLRWTINEMERRYKLFARSGVRNIRGFNSRPIVSQPDLFGSEEEEERLPDRLPYIVVIIDELADLMMVAQAEIENAIARLAQLSRAVGIHMILATQRPSVNVITGTIKANFPARIAFQVAQKVDSRTILDANGADQLLGKGDMLFLPPGSSKLLRAQGTLTSDEEIKRLVEFIRAQGRPQYEIAIKEKIESKAPPASDGGDADEELIEQATEIIRQTQRASTSSLQRRLRIGYTRAARVMDILEERGIVGPPRGSDPREILVDLDGGPQEAAAEPGEET